MLRRHEGRHRSCPSLLAATAVLVLASGLPYIRILECLCPPSLLAALLTHASAGSLQLFYVHLWRCDRYAGSGWVRSSDSHTIHCAQLLKASLLIGKSRGSLDPLNSGRITSGLVATNDEPRRSVLLALPTTQRLKATPNQLSGSMSCASPTIPEPWRNGTYCPGPHRCIPKDPCNNICSES